MGAPVERCPGPRERRFVSVHGVAAGIYGEPEAASRCYRAAIANQVRSRAIDVQTFGCEIRCFLRSPAARAVRHQEHALLRLS
jgi:hypothetical protein